MPTDSTERLGELQLVPRPAAAIAPMSWQALPDLPFVDPFYAELMATLRRFAARPVAERALPLVGLGGGLTPAGDDLLVGLLAGMLLGRHDVLRAELVTQLRANVRDRTTTLSAVMLEMASVNRYPRPIAALLTALAEGRVAQVKPLAALVAQLGHSSGRAVLCGLKVGCALVDSSV